MGLAQRQRYRQTERRMIVTRVGASSPQVERQVTLAFAPLHKAAFGAAIGAAAALLVFLATAILLLRNRVNEFPLSILAVYFRGYSVSWSGALIGAAWAGAMGFVFGWFTAFTRNLALAVSAFLIRTRAERAMTRDFLDHV